MHTLPICLARYLCRSVLSLTLKLRNLLESFHKTSTYFSITSLYFLYQQVLIQALLKTIPKERSLIFSGTLTLLDDYLKKVVLIPKLLHVNSEATE